MKTGDLLARNLWTEMASCDGLVVTAVPWDVLTVWRPIVDPVELNFVEVKKTIDTSVVILLEGHVVNRVVACDVDPCE